MDTTARTLDEAFEIRLTNRKEQPVAVNLLEHLNRGENREIEKSSVEFARLDSHSGRFPVPVAAKAEATLSYSIRYSR